MVKWWLLAIEKLHVSVYGGHLQVLTTFLLKEFYIICLNRVVMLKTHHHFTCFFVKLNFMGWHTSELWQYDVSKRREYQPNDTAVTSSNLALLVLLRCYPFRNIHFDFDVLLTVHLSIFISVINELDAQIFCFTVSLFHASTCFEHTCSSSGGQNCIKQPLASSHLYVYLWYHHTYTRGRVMQFWPPDDEHMCSKHVEAWNKLTVKQKFCA